MNDASQAHSNYDRMPESSNKRTIARMTKAEIRTAFRVAIENGMNVSEASRAVGINRNTGAIWARQIRASKSVDTERGLVADKAESAKVLTEIIRSPSEAAPYKVNAVTRLSAMMGWDAPTRSQVEVRQVPASVSAWLDGLTVDAIDVAPEPPAIVGAPTSSAQLTPAPHGTAGTLPAPADQDHR